jgi:DNA-directed RNA polymerase subunit RPC12/RpoP
MNRIVSCPSCGKRYSSSAAGGKFQCPNCGNAFVVSSQPPKPEPPEPAPPRPEPVELQHPPRPHRLRSAFSRVSGQPTRKAAYWLRFYAKVNFVLACFGALGFGFWPAAPFSMLGFAAAGIGSKGMAALWLFVWLVVFVISAAVIFFFMNILTVWCLWGAEVLEELTTRDK